jgi:hypothetical protein
VADHCTAGACGGAARNCNAVGDQCNDGVCDESTDACIGPPKTAGTPCNDQNACTTPDVCDGGGICSGTPDTFHCLDAFTCYKSGRAPGGTKFEAVTGVTLTDQFRTSTVTVTKPRRLCTPTDPGGEEDAIGHTDHLEDYQIKPAFSFVGGGQRTITNQFGTIVVNVLKPTALFEPTLASTAAPPGALAVPAVDPFQCYTVKIATGAPRFQRFELAIADRFGPRVVTVMKPRRLCAPVDDGTAPSAETHPNHLLCYQIKEYSLPKFARVAPIYTHGQFGPEAVDARAPNELCVPSLKSS